MAKVLVGSILLTVLCAGCGDDDLFISCPLDQDLSAICQQSDGERSGDDDLTCVVESHPQCPHDICIKWRHGEPTCSRTCDPNAADCPTGSSCTPFNKLQQTFYCVKDEFLQ